MLSATRKEIYMKRSPVYLAAVTLFALAFGILTANAGTRRLYTSNLGVRFPSYSSTNVRGYVRRDGGFVLPHFRSRADGTVLNNWSSSGNWNPYTGKKGYRYW